MPLLGAAGKLGPAGRRRPVKAFNPASQTPTLNLVNVLFPLQFSRFPSRWRTPDTLTLGAASYSAFALYSLTLQLFCKDEQT